MTAERQWPGCAHLLFRSILVAGLTAALTLFVALPKAPPSPFFAAGGSVEHSSKFSRAGEAGIEGAADMEPIIHRAYLPGPRFESFYVTAEAVLFLKLSQMLCTNRFRPPPLL